MPFIPYVHLEKFNTDEVEGLVNGQDYVYIFPKLDGTNASMWYNPQTSLAEFGSRRRQISLSIDNRGFCETILSSRRYPEFLSFMAEHSRYIFYGEWLVKHTLSTYLDSAWKRFYIFDVYDLETEEFLSFDEYHPMVEILSVIDSVFQLVSPLAIAKTLTPDTISKALEQNYYLMKEGELGEGIVIKRYGFRNKYGRVTWAKAVRTEFTAKHIQEMGPVVINSKESLEEKIVDKYLTEHLVLKTSAKILSKYGLSTEFQSKHIPELLSTVWHDFVNEELWEIIKVYKNPTINFKQLHKLCNLKVKKIVGI